MEAQIATIIAEALAQGGAGAVMTLIGLFFFYTQMKKKGGNGLTSPIVAEIKHLKESMEKEQKAIVQSNEEIKGNIEKQWDKYADSRNAYNDLRNINDKLLAIIEKDKGK